MLIEDSKLQREFLTAVERDSWRIILHWGWADKIKTTRVGQNRRQTGIGAHTGSPTGVS